MSMYIDEIFDRWVDSMNIIDNRREHLKSQKIFHIDFGVELLKVKKHEQLEQEYRKLQGMIFEWYLKYGKDEKFAAFFGIEAKRQGETQALKGGRPDRFDKLFEPIDNLPPDFDTEEFKKLWEACIPKVGNVGIPMIFGTGGEQQIGEDYFKKMWENSDKQVTMDLILLSKNQYKAKNGSYKKATICIDGNYYALKDDVYNAWNAEDYYNK